MRRNARRLRGETTVALDVPLRVLFDDGRDWLVVEKPAGMLSTGPTGGGAPALDERVRATPGRVQAHAVSRLDVDVSGAVLFALSARARREASDAKLRGAYARGYVALAVRAPTPPEGQWERPIGLDPRDRRRRVVDHGDELQPAQTRFALEARGPGGEARLRLEPITGRTHQLRVHAAAAGCALLGDGMYGGPRRVVSEGGAVHAVPRVMLHARWVRVPGEGAVCVECDVPRDFAEVERVLAIAPLPR